MAWRSYDYGYGGDRGYERGIYRGPYRRGYGGWAAYEPQGTERYRWRYGNDYRYGYDYRRPPEQSPTYGQAGDRAAREYARSHGYDTGYSIRPGEGGFRGAGGGSAYGRDRGGWPSAGPRYGGWTGQGEGRYDWGYRW